MMPTYRFAAKPWLQSLFLLGGVAALAGSAFAAPNQNQKKPDAALASQNIDLPEIVVKLKSEKMAENFGKLKNVPIKIAYPGGWVVYQAGSVGNAHKLSQDWQNDPLIEFCSINQKIQRVQHQFVPNDPFFTFNNPAGELGQWNLRNTSNIGGAAIDINVSPFPWSINLTGTGVLVGVVDNGVQSFHPDLSPNYSFADSFDFAFNDTNAAPDNVGDFHGTAAAGIIAARGGNGIGITGAAPFAGLAGLKVNFASPTAAMFAAATEFNSSGSTRTIKIKNHSYGSSTNYEAATLELAALANSASAGTIHFFSAGNDRGSAAEDTVKKELQNSPNAITVAALAPRGTFANYSNFGANVFVTAPSSGFTDFTATPPTANITTTDMIAFGGLNGHPDFDYTNAFTGTSAAAAAASGVAAVVKQFRPNLDARYLKHLLVRSARKIDLSDASPESDGGWKTNGAGLTFNQNYGFGLIDATSLRNRTAEFVAVTPLTQTSSGTIAVGAAIADSTSNGTLGTPTSRTTAFTTRIPLEEVEVTLDITHTFRGDLEAYLTSPSGTKSRLMRRSSSDGVDNINWTFTSNAFWGENPSGTWTLEVADAFVLDTGTWNSFAINLRQGALVPPFLTDPGDSVIGGSINNFTTFRVGLIFATAPAGGLTFNVTHGSSLFSLPSTLTISEGGSLEFASFFPIATPVNVTVPVTTSIGSFSETTNVVVRKVDVESIVLSPTTVAAGGLVTGTVTLNAEMSSDTVVNLVYSPGSFYSSAPATVTIPAGNPSASFTFRPNPAIEAGFTGTVIAALNGDSRSAIFTAEPTKLRGTFVYPMNAVTGQTVFVTTLLNTPQATDTSVTVSSSNTSILGDLTPTIPAGSPGQVNILELGNPASLDRFQNITLTTTALGETRTSTFQVRPPTNALASGFNNNFQVGDGTNRLREFFSAINTTNNIVQAVASANCLVVLKSDGTVWTVGQGTFGQHGDGTSGVGAIKTVLTQVPGLSNIKLISANAPTILALDSNREVWAWGQNNVGQCARTPLTNVTVPTKIVGLSSIVNIAVGAFAGFALDSTGQVWSWGSSLQGANGRATNNTVPALLPISFPIVDIAAGNQHGFAIRADGQVIGWGKNLNGELGDGTFVSKFAPISIAGLTDIRMIQGGLDHSILLRISAYGGNRQVMTTGSNSHGQRGDGLPVGGPSTNTWNTIASATNITQVASGNRHSFFIGAGAVRSWGFGSNGERADGSIVTSRNTPNVLPETVASANILASAANSVSMTGVRNNGRGEALMINTATRTFRTTNFRTGVETALTGSYPVGHSVVGGGEVAGSTGTSEIVTMETATRALFRHEVTGTTLGASTALNVTLNANESLRFIANMDNTGRMDFVTQDSVTRAIAARLYNGTAQTGTYNLYTLAANETLVGVGDFNLDSHQDLLIFNTATRVLTARLYRFGVFQTLRNFTDAPAAGSPVNIPAVPAGLTPVAAAESQTPNSYELIFVTGTGAIEIWDMSRLNRISVGTAGPTIPNGHAFSRMFWR
jgi:alpha-tubulin suppressor-like RCC1 family protein/subtilisin-like proprotein convertase family protein